MPSVAQKIKSEGQQWLIKISNDEIDGVVEDVLGFVGFKENEAFACKCLLVCSKLVYSEQCSSPDALFRVVEACCIAIAPSYNTDHLKLINSLYHVTNFLLNENRLKEALLISKTIINVKRKKSSSWSANEENTITAFLHSFSKALMSFDYNESMLGNPGTKATALDLWSHVTSLCLCSNNRPLSDLFAMLINVSLKGKKAGKEKCADFLLTCLQSFLNQVEKTSSAEKIKLEELVFCRILQVYRHIVLNYIVAENVSALKDPALKLLTNLKKSFLFDANQTSIISVCEKIIQFAYRSMLDVNLDPKLLKYCIVVMEKWNNGSQLYYSVAYWINSVLMKLRGVWAKKPPKLPAGIFAPIIKLISLSHTFLDGNRTEICSQQCELKCDESTILQSKCIPFIWFMIFYTQNPEESSQETSAKLYLSIYKDVKGLMSEILDFLLKAHEAKCTQLPSFFAYSFPYFLNTISGYIRSNLHQQAFDLILAILQTCAKLPQLFLDENFTEKLVSKSFGVICCCCKHLDKFPAALSIISAWAVLLPSKREVLFKLWASFKGDVFWQKDKKLEPSVWHVLKFNASKLKKDWNVSECSSEDFTVLLIEEMRAYCKYDLPYNDSFLSVFDACQKLKPSADQEATILCLLIRSLTRDTSCMKKLVPILGRVKDVGTRLCTLRKKSETKEKVRIDILLGCLGVARSCCLILKIRSQNEAELNSQSKAIEEPKNNEPGTEVNPNDTCVVTSALSCLKVDKHQQLFELLDEALEYLCTAKKVKAMENITFDSGLFFDSIVDAAQTFKIYGYETAEYRCWDVGFKVCSSLKQNEEAITCMANILGFASPVNPKWVALVDGMVKSLDASKIALRYQYNLACIRNRLINQEYDGIDKLFQEIDLEELRKYKLFYAEYFVLLSKCFFNPDVSPMDCALEAYICLMAMVKEKVWSNFTESFKVNCLLFEVTLNAGENFIELMMPRETRSVLKSQLKLAQTLALPLRTAQVLVQLTWVDMMCCNKTDSLSKIQTLEEILQLPSRVSNLVPVKTGSRRTRLVKVEPPDFLKHENCRCYVCSSSLYQQVILETLRLQAAYSNLHKELRNYCMDFLKCAQNMLMKLCQSHKEGWMQLSELKLFVQYTDYLTLVGSLKEAQRISKVSSQFVSGFPDSHPCNKILTLEMSEQRECLNRALNTTK